MIKAKKMITLTFPDGNKKDYNKGVTGIQVAENIANHANCDLGKISIKTFSDGELWIKYQENIIYVFRGSDRR